MIRTSGNTARDPGSGPTNAVETGLSHPPNPDMLISKTTAVTRKYFYTSVAKILPTISLANLESNVQTAAALLRGKATLAPLHVVRLVGSDS